MRVSAKRKAKRKENAFDAARRESSSAGVSRDDPGARVGRTLVTKLHEGSVPPRLSSAIHGPSYLFLSRSQPSMGTANRSVPATPPGGMRGPNVASSSVNSREVMPLVRTTTRLPSSLGSCETAASTSTTAMGSAAQHRAKNAWQRMLPRRDPD